MKKLLKFLFLQIAVLTCLDPAIADFCSHGTAELSTCGCTCFDTSTSSFDGRDCFCDPGKLTPSDSVINFSAYDISNGCAESCPYAGYSLDWYCDSYYHHAVWDSTECGCKCTGSFTKDGTGTTCACKDSDSTLNCTSQGKVFDDNSCTCDCPSSAPTASDCASQHRNYDAGSCACTGCTDSQMSPTDCSCPSSPPAHATYDSPSSCNWSCVTLYVKISSACILKTCADKCVGKQGDDYTACIAGGCNMQ